MARPFLRVALLALALWACEDEATPGNQTGGAGGAGGSAGASTGGQGGATPQDAADDTGGAGGQDPDDASGDLGGAGGAGGGPDDGGARACAWGKLPTLGTSPPFSGFAPRPLYDPIGRRLIAVTRRDSPAITLDVFSLPLTGEPRWTMQTPQASPDGGSVALPSPGALLVRDRRLYAFQSPREALISLDLDNPTAWEVVATEGTSRLGRLVNNTALFWDAPANRMIFYGGYGFEGVPPDFPYELSFANTPATWNPLTLAAPITAGMGVFQAIHDEPRRRLVVYMETGGVPAQQSLHELSLADPATWTQLPLNGVTLPSVRGCSRGYDSRGHRMMFFGAGVFDHGNTGGAAGAPLDGGEDLTARVYSTSLDGEPHWRLLPTRMPGPRWGSQAAVYDEANDRMLLIDPAPAVDQDLTIWFLDLASCR
jgi:hypothetical protein